jgi:hypothetical protein
MRIIIDISKDQINALDELSRLEETSRVALVRLAIDQFLARQTHEERARELAFGIWADRLEKAKSARRAKRESEPADPPAGDHVAAQQASPQRVEAGKSEVVNRQSEVGGQKPEVGNLPPTELAARGAASSRSPSGGEQRIEVGRGTGGEQRMMGGQGTRERGTREQGTREQGTREQRVAGSNRVAGEQETGADRTIEADPGKGYSEEPMGRAMAAEKMVAMEPLPPPPEPVVPPVVDAAPATREATLSSSDPLAAFFLAGRGTP